MEKIETNEKIKINRLTKRQKEVLIAYAEHAMYRPAAESLGITHDTFKNHCHAIFQKLEVESISQALMIAFRAGIIE